VFAVGVIVGFAIGFVSGTVARSRPARLFFAQFTTDLKRLGTYSAQTETWTVEISEELLAAWAKRAKRC
jgi:hypothetical protein